MGLILWIVGVVAWIFVGIFVTKIFCKAFDEARLTTEEITMDIYIEILLGIIFWPILSIVILFVLAVYGIGCGFIRITQWIVR